MKNIKKYVMGLVAMTIAIGTVTLMSMTAGKEVKLNEEPVDWVFTGTDPLNPEHYEREIPINPATCPGLPETICKIMAPENSSGQPDMEAIVSENGAKVEEEVEAALESLQPSKTPTLNDVVTSFRSL